MWMRLNEPGVSEEVAREVNPGGAKVLSRLIEELSARPWAGAQN